MAEAGGQANSNWQSLVLRKASEWSIWLIIAVMLLFGLLFYGNPAVHSLAGLVPAQSNQYSFGLFTTDAAIVATVLTITFSFSIFTVQHAASNYSSSLLSSYTRDPRTWASFGALVAVAIFNLIGASESWGSDAVFLSLYLTLASFIILASQFKDTANAVNPVNLIRRIESHARNTVSKGKDVRLNPKSETNAEDQDARREASSVILESANESLTRIMNVTQWGAERRDVDAYSAGLDSLVAIALESVNNKSSFDEYELFLNDLIMQIETISETAIEKKDVTLLNAIAKALQSIGSSTDETEATLPCLVYLRQIGMRVTHERFWNAYRVIFNALSEIGRHELTLNGAWASTAVDSIIEVAGSCVDNYTKEWHEAGSAADYAAGILSKHLVELVRCTEPARVSFELQSTLGRIKAFIERLVQVKDDDFQETWTESALCDFLESRITPKEEHNNLVTCFTLLVQSKDKLKATEIGLAADSIVDFLEYIAQTSFKMKFHYSGSFGITSLCLIADSCIKQLDHDQQGMFRLTTVRIISLLESLYKTGDLPVEYVEFPEGRHSAFHVSDSVVDSLLRLTLRSGEMQKPGIIARILDTYNALIHLNLPEGELGRVIRRDLVDGIVMTGAFALQRGDMESAKDVATRISFYGRDGFLGKDEEALKDSFERLAQAPSKLEKASALLRFRELVPEDYVKQFRALVNVP